jgi:hypothetical protein
MKTQHIIIMSGVLAALTSLSVYAAPIGYTSASDFNTAISGMTSQTLNFDSQTVGTNIADGSSLNGITFDYDFDGLEMLVSDQYDTTSGDNYLGINDGSDESFFAGDSFTLSFDSTINAFGLLIISIDEIFDADFSLETSVGEVTSQASVQDTLADDSSVFFLGLYDEDGFDSISFSSGLFACDCFYFNIDDITTAWNAPTQPTTEVPEPATWSLLLFGLASISFRRRFLAKK